ncbi:LysR family transcriptional regulator [Paracoccus versutus]|jgi:DNA-binding transcriptional LysR family regulator
MPDLAFDLRYLRYAILVAQHGSFRAAAESLDHSQSTVSRRVRLLERRLGVPLFERDHKGAKLTPAGQRFIQDATVGANLLSDAVRDLRNIQRGGAGEIRIGLMLSLASGFLADLLKSFRSRYPDAEITVEEMSSDCAKIGLLCNRVDVAFLPNVEEIPGCQAIDFWGEQVFCALPKDHRLADRETLSWEHIADEAFLVPSGGAGAELDVYFLRKLSGGRADVRMSMQSVGRENLLNMVSDGYGVALLLASATQQRQDDVAFIPLNALHEPVRFSAVWSQTNANPVVQRLLEMARKKAGKLRTAK